MSAFIVGKVHIDLLVRAAVEGVRECAGPHWMRDRFSYYHAGARVVVSDENASVLGRMLWTENLRSVADRYPDDSPMDRPGPVTKNPAGIDSDIMGYEYERPGPFYWHPSIVEVAKALACYEYQSCEHDGWEGSEAFAFVRALEHRILQVLPGYEKAPWEWSMKDLPQDPRAARVKGASA